MFTFLLALISGNTVPGTAVDFDYRKALSLGWWLQHFADAYNANPLHMVTELVLVVVVVWLLFKRERSSSGGKERLTTREEQELIDEWQPEPLVPEQMNLWSRESVHLNCGAKATASDGEKEYIHLASHNYLGFADRSEIKEVATATIKECAVGSCGPRGFYGTMDIHLNLEKKIGEYFGATCIIYPDYMGCNASVITAFAKKGDLLLIDEGCHFLITQGAMLSRANVIWYKHNDMNHLSTCLQTVQEEDERHNRPLNRRFIVTEGLFHNSGDICNLSEIVKLKEEYKYRLILDDTHGLGGLHSKGTPGFWNISMSKIDVYVGSMDTALGSTGAFCVGTRQVTDHQRLSAAGYVFTASSPMFQCVAAQKALELLQSEGQVLINKLHVNSKLMRNKLKDRGKRWRVLGNAESPLIHIRLLNVSDKRAEVYMEDITLQCRQKGVLVFPAAYLPQEYGIREKSNPKPSLRICVTAQHTAEQLEAAADVIVDVMCKVMDSNSYVSEESDLDSSVIQ